MSVLHLNSEDKPFLFGDAFQIRQRAARFIGGRDLASFDFRIETEPRADNFEQRA